MRPYSYRRKR